MKHPALLFFCLFFFAAPLAAQTPTTESDAPIVIATNLVRLDVTVTDAKGRVVGDLQPDDFEIYDNGQRQKLASFSYLARTPHAPPRAAAGGGDKVPASVAPLKRGQVRRTYALVVDDLGLSFNNLTRVRQALRKFIDDELREGDLVAVLRTGGGIGALQSFTADRRQLLAAVERLKWNAYGRAATESYAPIDPSLREEVADGRPSPGVYEERRLLRQADESRRNNFTVGTLGALDFIVRGMQNLPGRKALILFSEGFPLGASEEGKTRSPRVFEALRALAALADRSSVVLSAIDPRGLQTPSAAGADDKIRKVLPDDFDPTRFDDGRGRRETNFADSQQSLRYLAGETGGRVVLNRNEFESGLRQAVDDLDGYYLLGYEPDAETFDAAKAKFDRLEIRVRRPGLVVRYRRGAFGGDGENRPPAPATPQQRILAALASPFGSGEIALGLYPVFGNESKGGDYLAALVRIDARDLQFTMTNAGKYRTSLELLAVVYGENGAPVDRLAKSYTLEVAEPVYQNMLRHGFVYRVAVPLKKPGPYQFRIALRDAVSDKIGAASQFVEVPDVKKGLVVSNLLLDNFTNEEWRRVRPPGSRPASETSELLDTTGRRFKTGSILQFSYFVYNLRGARGLSTQTKLFRDGRLVLEYDPQPLGTEGVDDPRRVPAGGALALGSDLAPGHYVLQISAFDESGPARAATRFVEFEIAP